MTYWLINQINRFINNQGVIIIVIMIYYFRYFTHFRRSNCMETQLFCSLFGLITDQKILKFFYCFSLVIHFKIRKSNLFLQHPTFYRRHEYRVWYEHALLTCSYIRVGSENLLLALQHEDPTLTLERIKFLDFRSEGLYPMTFLTVLCFNNLYSLVILKGL